MIAPDAYCREIEAYLCRKNDGHLIRLSGPAFDLVRGWAARGIPLAVAFAGIDRCFERYYRKGPRRRPVHVEFCEADVLDAFDEWRRATGVAAAEAETPAQGATERAARADSLAGHIERVLARLTALRGSQTPAPLREALEEAVRALDGLRAEARRARGERREALRQRLQEIDAALVAAARSGLAPAEAAALRREAGAELAPFAPRMTPDALAAATEIAFARLLRRRAGLPAIAVD